MKRLLRYVRNKMGNDFVAELEQILLLFNFFITYALRLQLP